jgi:hypothetical protein
MAGGAGNIGSAGGMGNASAQPQGGPFGGGMGGGQQSGGGVPSFAQPYMNNLGGGMGGGQQSSGFGPGVNNFGSGYGGSPFGMQQQQPMQNPFGQMGALSSPGYGAAEFQQQQRGVLGQGGQQQQPNQPQSFEQYRATPRMQDQAARSPEQQLQEDQKSYEAYKNNFGQPQGQQQMQNPFDQQAAQAFMRHQQMGQLGAANQMPQPMGQRPAYMDNPDFQAYQKQEQDLGRQMNEYMQKAPMFQQLQDLQGKLRGFQQPQQGQMQNPYGNIDQMQQQRNMQDQARQQRMYEQATQDDMRAAVMPNQSGYQGQMGDTGFRAMPAVMPQQPDPGMMDALTLHSAETYGNQRMGGGFGRRGMGGGYGQQMPQQAMGLQGLYSMLQGRRGGPFGGY